jgi:hypothetical protein
VRALSPRHVERFLRAAQWALVVGIAWLLIGMVLGSKAQPRPNIVAGPVTEGDAAPSSKSQQDLDQFAGIWKRDLRQTLIEPKPKPKPKPKRKAVPPPKPPQLPRLLATFVEHGSAWGLFVDTKGATRVRRSGASIDAFDIASIGRGSARLRRGSHTYEVSVPVSKSAGSSGKKWSRTIN